MSTNPLPQTKLSDAIRADERSKVLRKVWEIVNYQIPNLPICDAPSRPRTADEIMAKLAEEFGMNG